jgi:hypothetical protein
MISTNGILQGTGGLLSQTPMVFPVSIPANATSLQMVFSNASRDLPITDSITFGTVSTFTYTGAAQSYTVPAGSLRTYCYLWGAGGGRNGTQSGSGAFVSGYFTTVPGQVLSVIVGRGGHVNGATRNIIFGGGGQGWYTYFGGGGFSGIFSSTTYNTSTTIAIAGGGGCASFGGVLAGSGGVINGQDAIPASGTGGRGGTQTAGGDIGGMQFLGANTLNENPGAGGGWYGGGVPSNNYNGTAGGSSYTGGITVLETQDGVRPNGIAFTQPGGITNSRWVSPLGQASQHGLIVLVASTPLSAVRLNARVQMLG